MECVSLRVKDVDFDRHEVLVREGKGGKDRVSMLPQTLVSSLQEHLQKVRVLFEMDRNNDVSGVAMLDVLSRKYPEAGKSWGCFCVQLFGQLFIVSSDRYFCRSAHKPGTGR
jgi:integrase